jgi:phosphoglycolate phosphatase
MLLPLSAVTKGVLWTVFFGLAKACQYAALVILGKAGVERLKVWLQNWLDVRNNIKR